MGRPREGQFTAQLHEYTMIQQSATQLFRPKTVTVNWSRWRPSYRPADGAVCICHYTLCDQIRTEEYARMTPDPLLCFAAKLRLAFERGKDPAVRPYLHPLCPMATILGLCISLSG
jgi:hypothetical protein